MTEQVPSEEREKQSGKYGDQTSPVSWAPVASGSLPNTLAAPISLEEQANRRLEGCIQEDGGLYKGSWYLSWIPDATTATLDGEFNAHELRAIADYMEGK